MDRNYGVASGLYYDVDGSGYYGRVIFQEALQTFAFTLIYLIVRYERTLKKTDLVIKGLGLAFAMSVALSMTAGSGGSLNPAFALAQVMYTYGN
jgi:glycerol uptake facilitator-like aquaporin